MFGQSPQLIVWRSAVALTSVALALQVGCAPAPGARSNSERAQTDKATDGSLCVANPRLDNLAAASKARLWELYGHYKLCPPTDLSSADVALKELISRSDPYAQYEAAVRGWRDQPDADNSQSIAMFKAAAGNGSAEASRALQDIERGEFP